MGCHNIAQTAGTLPKGTTTASANFGYLLQRAQPHYGRAGRTPQPEEVSGVAGSVIFNPYVVGGAGGT